MGQYYVHKDHMLQRTGACPDGMELLQARAGEVVELGEIATGNQPSPFHQFNVTTGVWIDPRTQTERNAAQWEKVRYQRQKLLMASDWSTLPDVPLSVEARAQWAAYRQALRDVTNQPDPRSIVWPVPPSN